MTDQLTEDDLRAALLTRAPADLDATDFRARLDRLIADGGDAGPAVDVEDTDAIDLDATVIPLTPAVRERRSTRSRIGVGVAVAACVAAIAALVVALLPGGTDRTAPADTVPKDVRSQLLPGTIVVGTYRGTGSRDITVPEQSVPRYFDYGVYGTCTGGGGLFVGKVGSPDTCDSTTPRTFGNSVEVDNGRIAVQAAATASWQITVVIEPQLRTNAGVGTPVDANLSGPDNGLRHSGEGTATVHFAGAADPYAHSSTTEYFVNLVCHGDGVSMPGLKGQMAPRGLSTKTCFAGRQYSWQYVRVTLPADIRIVASRGTTWTVYFDPAN